MDDRTVIINVKCSEPEGEVVRSVRLAHLNVERMQFLWEKLKGFDTLFNDFVKDDYAAFVNHFVMEYDGEPVPTGLLWDVDDIGIFLLQDIIPHQSATAHFVFWDKRFRGREALCIEMLRYAFENYKFERIEVQIPLYANHTQDAVEKLGFVQEGRLRRAILYHDKWFDMLVYSVLLKDLENRSPINWSTRRTTCFSCGQVFNKRRENYEKIRKKREVWKKKQKNIKREVSDGRA